MMDAWWTVCDRECARYLDTYDLGWASIYDGRTAVVCWLDEAVPKIIIDQPLAEALMARDAGFQLLPLLRSAITQFQQRGGVVTVPMGRADRQIRRHWLKTRGRQAS